jgi:hypothetical protein
METKEKKVPVEVIRPGVLGTKLSFPITRRAQDEKSAPHAIENTNAGRLEKTPASTQAIAPKLKASSGAQTERLFRTCWLIYWIPY